MSAIPFIRRTSNERVDGTLTVKIDIEPAYKLQFLTMFPQIGCEGALAALVKGASAETPKEEKTKPGELCIMACNFCDDPMFRKWIVRFDQEVTTCSELDAREAVLEWCGIESRRELDTNEKAARIFHTRIRKPFLAWKEKQ